MVIFHSYVSLPEGNVSDKVRKNDMILIWLVVTGTWMDYFPHFRWDDDPIWRTQIFRGVGLNHQLVASLGKLGQDHAKRNQGQASNPVYLYDGEDEGMSK